MLRCAGALTGRRDQNLGQRLAVHEWHREVQAPLCITPDVVHGQHARVSELACDLSLLQEARRVARAATEAAAT